MRPKYYQAFKKDCQDYNIDSDMCNEYLQITWKQLRKLYFRYVRLKSKFKEE